MIASRPFHVPEIGRSPPSHQVASSAKESRIACSSPAATAAT